MKETIPIGRAFSNISLQSLLVHREFLYMLINRERDPHVTRREGTASRVIILVIIMDMSTACGKNQDFFFFTHCR